MVSRRKLQPSNFCRLTIADESYYSVTFIGPPLVDGS
jgi:hypothetical protein